MGLFDRIARRDDEEVELKPPQELSWDEPVETESAEDTQEETEFLLPGMAPAADTESKDTSSVRVSSTEEPTLERIAAQNDRIIELLEQLVDKDEDTGVW